MSNKSDNRINVLQNIVLETNSVENVLQQTNSNINGPIPYNDKENNFNYAKRRYTGSTYIFDEEPVFSDSDEEEQYCKNMLAAQKIPNGTTITPKKLDTEVQGNLSADDLKIVDVIKECTSINVDNVNDDFKQLINLCKELHTKYITLSSVVNTNNKLVEKEVFASRNSTSQNLKNVEESIPILTAEDQFTLTNLIPSRNGNSSGANDFYFQAFSSDSGFSNVSCITECPVSNEEKENIVRRSSRTRKPPKANKSGIFITRKEGKLLNRSRKRLKTEKVKVKQRNASKKLFPKKKNGINTLKQKVNKGVSKARTIRNDGRNIERKNKSPLVKPMKQTTQVKPMKPTGMVSLKECRDDIFHVKALDLPTKQRRSLAKNWMKPNKILGKNILPDSGSVSMQQKQKLRRLYSPDDWLHSKEYENLCVK